MRSFITRLLLAATSCFAALGVSLWWCGARMADPARVERVAAAALGDPTVRTFVDDQISRSVSVATGIPQDVVLARVASFDPVTLAAVVRARIEGAGIDSGALAQQILAGQTAAAGSKIPVVEGGVDPGVLGGVGVFDVVGSVGSYAKWAAFGSVAAAAAAFVVSRRRDRTLRTVGRSWLLSGGGVMAVAWAIPRIAQSRDGVWWAVVRAWLDKGVDTALPLGAMAAGAVCYFGGGLFRRR